MKIYVNLKGLCSFIAAADGCRASSILGGGRSGLRVYYRLEQDVLCVEVNCWEAKAPMYNVGHRCKTERNDETSFTSILETYMTIIHHTFREESVFFLRKFGYYLCFSIISDK